jgi:hypothetical protein
LMTRIVIHRIMVIVINYYYSNNEKDAVKTCQVVL